MESVNQELGTYGNRSADIYSGCNLHKDLAESDIYNSEARQNQFLRLEKMQQIRF